MTKIELQCVACGKPFTRSVSQARLGEVGVPTLPHCSIECRRTGMEKQCERCGKSFYVRRYEVEQRRWCSRECAGIGGYPATMDGPRTGEFRSCKGCGETFYVYPSTLRKPGRTADFCGRSCYSKEIRSELMQGKNLGKQRTPEQREKLKGRNHYRVAHSAICEQCGDTIIYNHNRRHAAVRFCSRECWYDFIRANPDNHPSFKGGRFPYYGPNWPQQAKLARERDQHTCQSCGLHQFNPRLDVHHIRPRREFGTDFLAANDLANLTTLCKSCHAHIP